MGWLGPISVLSMALAGGLAGLRLLLIARRTREMPELLIGLSLSGLTLGYALIVAGVSLAAVPGQGVIAMGAGALLLNLAGALPAVFTQHVFRPLSRLALLLSLGLLMGAGFCWLGNGATMGFRFDLVEGTFVVPAGLIRVVALVWAALESLAYWHRMRRRMRIGLADPVVTNRFALWAAGTGAGALAATFGLLATSLGPAAISSRWVQLPVSLAGLVAAGAFVLAFLPPGWYRRRVETRARALLA